ncbi:MAG: hypothetical protein OHK0056_15070 [Bacteriovoracaceae bacterium]
MMGPEGGEVILEFECKDGTCDWGHLGPFRQVRKGELSDKELENKINYPVGISSKVPNDDSNSDKIAKKFFEGLEDGSKEEISKKEELYKKKVKDIDENSDLVYEEKSKLKTKAKQEFDKEADAIRKKKEDAFKEIYEKASACQRFLPETVKFVKEKVEGTQRTAQSSDCSTQQ